KKKARPNPADLATFVKDLSSELRDGERAVIEKTGRAVMRRLNRYEYENTVRDLLAVPWVQIKDRLPEDGEKYRFNKIGEALDVSYAQLSRHINTPRYPPRAAMRVQ